MKRDHFSPFTVVMGKTHLISFKRPVLSDIKDYSQSYTTTNEGNGVWIWSGLHPEVMMTAL